MAKGLVASDLRNSAEEELHGKLAEAKIELFNLRFQSATGQLDNHGRLRAVRKDISRIYTEMRERELGIGLPPAKQVAAVEPAKDAKADKKAKKADKADKADKKSKKKTEDES